MVPVVDVRVGALVWGCGQAGACVWAVVGACAVAGAGVEAVLVAGAVAWVRGSHLVFFHEAMAFNTPLISTNFRLCFACGFRTNFHQVLLWSGLLLWLVLGLWFM